MHTMTLLDDMPKRYQYSQPGGEEHHIADGPEPVDDFERIMSSRYVDRVRSVIARYADDAELIDDLTQEVFLRAYQYRATLDPERSLEGWLYKVAARIAQTANQTRVQDIDRRRTAATFFGRSGWRDAADPLDRIVANEGELMWALHRRYRDTLLLRHALKLTHADIARVTGTTRVAVTRRLARASAELKRLRRRWLKGLPIPLVLPAWLRVRSNRAAEAMSSLAASSLPMSAAILALALSSFSTPNAAERPAMPASVLRPAADGSFIVSTSSPSQRTAYQPGGSASSASHHPPFLSAAGRVEMTSGKNARSRSISDRHVVLDRPLTGEGSGETVIYCYGGITQTTSCAAYDLLQPALDP